VPSIKGLQERAAQLSLFVGFICLFALGSLFQPRMLAR
jgi:hypothetical protein